jgi:hypothetical protein
MKQNPDWAPMEPSGEADGSVFLPHASGDSLRFYRIFQKKNGAVCCAIGLVTVRVRNTAVDVVVKGVVQSSRFIEKGHGNLGIRRPSPPRRPIEGGFEISKKHAHTQIRA